MFIDKLNVFSSSLKQCYKRHLGQRPTEFIVDTNDQRRHDSKWQAGIPDHQQDCSVDYKAFLNNDCS